MEMMLHIVSPNGMDNNGYLTFFDPQNIII